MQRIVDVDEATGTVVVRNPSGVGNPKKFTFDQVYGEFSSPASFVFIATLC